jgi:hypothetical protein
MTAGLLAVSMLAPLLAGCGGSRPSGANLPPVDDTRGGTMAPPAPMGQNQPHTGMSTSQKAVLLVGAAALYYMYKKHVNAQNQPANVQYYLSKNGRVYYRDKNGQAHWVTPPTNGFQVPASEAAQYSQFQGYNGQTTGRDLSGLSNQ